MFKDNEGNKISAKAMAQLLLAQAVNRAIDQPDTEEQKATPREMEDLMRHMDTIGNAVLKKLHQPPRREE